MQDQEKTSLPRRRSVLAGIGVLAAAGLIAIYVMTGGHGNGGYGNDGAADCEASRATSAALAPFARGEVAAFQVAETPVPVGDLAFDNDRGEPVAISDWRGKTVLLNLWATWCAPCRHEMPALDALEKEMGGEAFRVVPVSVDLGEADKPKAFFTETGIAALPFFHDGTMGVFNALKKRGFAIGMPTTLLIDEEGCVLGSINGPAEWASEDAKALIGAAL